MSLYYGKVRICGDYKLAINQAASTETYPLPLIAELATAMSGEKYFSKLDLQDVYLQLTLDTVSKQYMAINTHRGLFQYNCLPFGIASAPAIFQCHIKTLLKGLDRVSVYLDNILVASCTLHEDLNHLAEVLQHLENSGMWLKKQKCFFLRSRIEYLGHVVDEEGIHPMEEKVKAIKEVPAPTNVTQLRSFLGLNNYYNKFLPNLAANLTPLYSLLNIHQWWVWNDEQQVAFQCAKDASSQMLFLSTTIMPSHWCWHVMLQIVVLGPSCHISLMVVKKGPSRTFPPLSSGETLLSARERSSGHHLHCEEVSSLLHRQTLHH